MRRIRAGDYTALGELYDRHARVVFATAMRTLHDRSDAEDVVHDAFLALVERAYQFDPARGSPLAWLLTTVRNLAIDLGRRRLRHARIAAESLCHEPGSVDPGVTSYREHQLGDDDWLGCITAAQRRTLEIAFGEGLSYAEIAKREGVCLGTVKSRAARALCTLRAAFVAKG